MDRNFKKEWSVKSTPLYSGVKEEWSEFWEEKRVE